ncbi:MAG: desulfoferrodoxin [Candidatus Helarchaeota archaeon]
MTKLRQIYKCEKCGNIVIVIHAGAGQLVCCGAPMVLLEEQTKDASVEKHVPYIEKTDSGYKVKVGQNQEHPMQDSHYIEWIQLLTEDKVYTKFLKPGDKPEAEFETAATDVSAREYCNVHGLWKS